MKRFSWFVMLIAAAILIIAGRELPRIGDPKAPAAIHVSPRYIERGHHETGAPNFVTAGLAYALILGIRSGRSGEGGDA